MTVRLRPRVLYGIRVIMVGMRDGREEGKKFGLSGHYDHCYVRMRGESEASAKLVMTPSQARCMSQTPHCASSR